MGTSTVFQQGCWPTPKGQITWPGRRQVPLLQGEPWSRVVLGGDGR